MIKLENINKFYKLKSGKKYHALNDVSIELKRGEFIAVVGRSGSGKSTLLNILGGLDVYDNGTFYIDDVNTLNYQIKDWDHYRNQRVGFIFQQFNLIYHLTVYENVELALVLNGLSKEERKIKTLEAIKKVGLEKHKNKKPGYLSGGEQQRVAIARAIVNDPDIILADEPTGQLDKKTATQIMDLIKEVSQNKLVIVVTHMEKLVAEYATRVIKISDGMIKEDTTLVAVKSNNYSTKENRKLKFKELSFLSFKNIRRKLIASLSLLIIYSFIISLILTTIVLSKKSVQNDIYHVLASDVPINLIEISKPNKEDFSIEEIYSIENQFNIQSVIPVYENPLNYIKGEDPKSGELIIKPIEYEILPQTLNEFYLKDAFVYGAYPTKEDEIIIDVYQAIALLDTEGNIYSRYQLDMISDNEIWEQVRNTKIIFVNENQETFRYNIVGIVNKTVWNYSPANVYFNKDAYNDIFGDNKPIYKLNIYIKDIDEKSRNITINNIKELNNEYYFDQSNINDVNAVYENFGQLIQFVNVITIVLLVISVISTFALINYNMHTRIKEVGILKSLGANAKNVKRIFVLEYLYIAFTSLILSFFITLVFINFFIKLTSSFYASSRITISNNQIYPDFITYQLVSLGGIILMYLSSILPIHIASKKAAIDIIRSK